MAGSTKRTQVSATRNAGIAAFIGLFCSMAFAVGAARPVVAHNTLCTADGRLLRGMNLNYGRSTPQGAMDWPASVANMKQFRDQVHCNCVRLCFYDGRFGDSRAISISQATAYADAAINSAESLGIYVILDYHSALETYATGQNWDPLKWWAVMAPRYKDKTWVIYELLNEPCQGAPGPYNEDIALMRIVRQAAPNTTILHFSPVGFGIGWGPYLKNTFATLAGFSWSEGKNIFGFHTYIGTPAVAIKDIQNSGVPIMCTEWGYGEDGWGPSDLGYARQSEFFERNCISHIDWHDWEEPAANILSHGMNILVPDATAKGYAWWTSPAPTAPGNFLAQAANSYTVNSQWDKPAVVGNGLVRYIVYRDGQEYGATTNTVFADNSVLEGSTHAYEVSALCVGGLESPKSTRISVTTPADNVPPTVSLVSGAGDGTMVQVVFSEAIEQAGAQTVGNFTIDNGIAVSSATLAADRKQVTLRTSPLSKGTTYTLIVNTIRDRAAAPNTIAANSRSLFQYVQGITRIRYYPRADHLDRVINAVFEGTNGSPTDGPYKALCSLPNTAPPAGWSEVTAFGNFDIGYRYIRYRPSSDAPGGNYGNIAEIEFYSGTAKVSGTPFGTPGSYNNSGNDFTKAFDGNVSTFFDYSQPYGAYTGLEIQGWSPVGVLSRPAGANVNPQTIRMSGGAIRLTIRGEGRHSIELLAPSGRAIRTIIGQGDSSCRISATAMAPGVYLMKTEIGSKRAILRFVVR